MAVRVAINGFGRIGRLVYRAALEAGRTDVEFVAINDLGPGRDQRPSAAIRFGARHAARTDRDRRRLDGCRARPGEGAVGTRSGPAALGRTRHRCGDGMHRPFTSREKAQAHLIAGAKKVLVSAPASGADLTVVYGVNDDKLEARHTVVSNASCTTNCLAPVAHVLHEAIGIERGFMTTIHAFTGDQPSVDTLHKDLRRARASAVSMIPTSTGAARAVGLVLPELNGKLDGTSIRVPTPNVSLIDFTFTAPRDTSVEEVNGAIAEAAAGPLAGVLATNEAPLVSSDFNHNPASSTFDLTQTQVIEGKFVRVLSWYDNEWGFSNRMSDTAAKMGALV